MITLKDLQERIMHINQAKGWYEDERTFGDDIALCHSELSEALEAFRDHMGWIGFSLDYGPDHEREVGKPEGAVAELADTVIRILDMAYRYQFDLEAAIVEKLKYNATRPYRHGGKVL